MLIGVNSLTAIASHDRQLFNKLLGMVQAWVAKKKLEHYMLSVFLMSDFINVKGDYW